MSFLALAALACGTAPLGAAPIIIDDFSTDLAPTMTNTYLDGTMLGGELDVSLSHFDAATFEIADGNGTLSGVIETGGPNNVQIIYDGNDSSGNNVFKIRSADTSGNESPILRVRARGR